MRTEDLISRCCVNCEHFALWDGDFCCAKKMRILQEAPGGEFTRDIILALKLNRDCDDYKLNNDSIYMDKFKTFISKVK